MRTLRLILLALVLSACQATPTAEPTPAEAIPALTSPLRTRIAFFSQDGSGGETTLSIINQNGTGLKNLTVPASQDFGAALSFDGQKIAYVSAKNIHVMNIDGSGDIQVTNFLNENHEQISETIMLQGPTWSSDSLRIAFIAEIFTNFSPTSNYYSINANKMNELTLPSGGYTWGFKWSPNGRKIAIAYSYEVIGMQHQLSPATLGTGNLVGKDQAWVDINESHKQENITCSSTGVIECAGYIQPSWSPDGEQIAFTGGTGVDLDLEIYVANADGTKRVKLTNNEAKDNFPLWSLDGRKILFLSDRSGTTGIYTMNVDGTEQTLLTDNAIPPNIRAVAWSPDSQKIVFTSNRDNDWQLYIMDANGSHQTRLTSLPGNKWGTVWIP